MRTNIVIDDALIAEAMRVSGHKTKRATVEEALRLLVELRRQRGILDLVGKVRWEGDLEASRVDREEPAGPGR